MYQKDLQKISWKMPQKSKPKQTQFKPNSNPISAQTNPKQTQSNPKRTQFSSCRSLSRAAQIPACSRGIATLVLQQRNCSSNGPAAGDPTPRSRRTPHPSWCRAQFTRLAGAAQTRPARPGAIWPLQKWRNSLQCPFPWAGRWFGSGINSCDPLF